MERNSAMRQRRACTGNRNSPTLTHTQVASQWTERFLKCRLVGRPILAAAAFQAASVDPRKACLKQAAAKIGRPTRAAWRCAKDFAATCHESFSTSPQKYSSESFHARL